MTREFEELQEALRQPATPEAMREAAQRFREYERVDAALGKRSRPTLVSLGLGKAYPTDVDLRDIPRQLETNPAFFEHMRKIVGED